MVLRASTQTISASTVDFRPTLTYESTSADLHCLTSFCAVCGVLFDHKMENSLVSSRVRGVTLVTNIFFPGG